ncbi:MAG TPA: HlyD family efflux transporter periplasmic adaptor subunit [Arachnia sp.]|nr:HlyD family efflux transporter periplasmic adaptor subunit [Arachnia sp.]HMT85881.1 HlyD family efflux transporter periplasmic adaptor subunit [Arachnia sp.]
MNRRRVLLVAIVGVVVLVVGVAAAAALLRPPADPMAGLTTTTVARGMLEATVTASGNTASGRTASLQAAGTGGIVEEVFVTTGQRVSRGDELVRFDDTAAQQQLDSALVQLESAQASLLSATQEQTSAERTADSAGIAAAEQSLTNAENALASAKDSATLVKRQQSELVGTAQDAVDRSARKIADLEGQLADLTENQPSDAGGTIEALEAELAAEKAALAQAEPALAQAKRTRDSAVLQAEQAVTSATGTRDSAKKALAQQKATVAVNRQGPKQGTVDSAQAQVDSAQLAVDQARAALDEAVLRAPFDGVVSTVNAVVGQSSSALSADGSSGLVELVDTAGMTVTASVAEADATSIKIGQAATITLPASGIVMTGTVESVDVRGTVTNNVVQYRTTVSVDSPPEEVRVGQTVSLSILTGGREDVLFVPTSAIATDGATSTVRMVVDGQLSDVEVTTGLVGTTGTEIVSGLEEGDVVLLSSSAEAPASGLFPGPGMPTR